MLVGKSPFYIECTLISALENTHFIMYEELEEEEDRFSFQKCPIEKKAFYKFSYGKVPKREYSDLKFDFEVVDFDHKSLRKNQQAIPSKGYIEENTLLLIKPSAMGYKNHIRKRLSEEGFITLKEMTLRLKKESISDFYDQHYGKPWFPKFVMKMISGPIHVMVLAKYNAIEDLKQLMGNKRVSVARRESPYSLRALYGLKGDLSTNGVHGSADRLNAAREIRFFFPQTIPEPIPEILENIDYIKNCMYDNVLHGVKEVNSEKPVQPLLWLGDWFLNNSQNTPIMEPAYLMKI